MINLRSISTVSEQKAVISGRLFLNETIYAGKLYNGNKLTDTRNGNLVRQDCIGTQAITLKLQTEGATNQPTKVMGLDGSDTCTDHVVVVGNWQNDRETGLPGFFIVDSMEFVSRETSENTPTPEKWQGFVPDPAKRKTLAMQEVHEG
jgi:hypothetical protein